MPLGWAASQIGSPNGANGPLHEENCECPPNDANGPLYEGSVPHERAAQNVGPLHERGSESLDSSGGEGRNGRQARGGSSLVSVVEEREREGMCVRCTQRPCCRSHDYSRASEPWVLDIVLADLIC